MNVSLFLETSMLGMLPDGEHIGIIYRTREIPLPTAIAGSNL